MVAITAAMPSGTGLDTFGKAYPDRTFDVGIAEQHAVTFAAGMATEGYKPFCTIYSTFLQRGYDQLVHDVALQNLPVRFAIDRAGLVGADGATHAGAFDIAYLACLPNMVVMAAADEAELKHMVATCVVHDSGPIALRYPARRGRRRAICRSAGRRSKSARAASCARARSIALLSLGTRLAEALKAAEELESRGLSATVADARFAKPLDREMILKLADKHEVLLTLEEGAVGGFGAHVLTLLAEDGPARSRPEGAHADAARPLPGSRQAGEALRSGRPRRRFHRQCPCAGGARAGQTPRRRRAGAARSRCGPEA